MVQSEGQGGEAIGQLRVPGPVQGEEGEAPEKELLQQRIAQSDISGGQGEGFPGNALLGGQIFRDGGQVQPGGKQQVAPQQEHQYAQGQKGGQFDPLGPAEGP